MNPKILFGLTLILLGSGAGAAVDTSVAVLWPEHQRAFIQDGPGLLLSEDDKRAFLAAELEERDRWMQEFLGRDPIPDTEENELTVGIERRMALVRHEEFLSFVDHRARQCDHALHAGARGQGLAASLRG